MDPQTLNQLIGLAMRAVRADPAFKPALLALNHARDLLRAGYGPATVRLAVGRAMWDAEAIAAAMV
jgi:hypothetical protein